MAVYNKRTKMEESLIKSEKFCAKILANRLNRNVQTIYSWAKELGAILPKEDKTKDFDHFFKKWSKEMAYVLGFVAADGSVFQNNKSGGLSIGLSTKDLFQLELIKKIIGAPQKIYIKKTNFNTEACVLTIGSAVIKNDLIALGITPRKSLTLKFPKNIPSEFIPHFIRGYFDGDGSVDIRKPTKSPNHNLRFQLLGTLDFLENVKKYFNSACSTDFGSIECRGTYYRFTVAGIKSAIKFGKWIYDNSDDLKLERKYNIYNKFMKDYSHFEFRKRQLKKNADIPSISRF